MEKKKWRRKKKKIKIKCILYSVWVEYIRKKVHSVDEEEEVEVDIVFRDKFVYLENNIRAGENSIDCVLV